MLVLPADVTDAASVAAAAARVREELGPIDLAVLSAGYWKQMDPSDWDTDVFDRHIQVNLTGMSNAIAAVLPEMLRRQSRGHRRHRLRGRLPRAGRRRGLRRDQGGPDQPAGVPARPPRPNRGAGHDVCPGFVRTDLTAGNRFPMPFIIDADQAARSICDGLERERTEIVFPARMALLMKAARLVPARAWTALWNSTSIARTRAIPTTSPRPGRTKDTMRLLRRPSSSNKPLDAVFDYLSDFTTTTEWDPGTVTTVRQHGDGGVGTTYLNTSTFLGRKTQLTYVVDEFVDRQAHSTSRGEQDRHRRRHHDLPAQ